MPKFLLCSSCGGSGTSSAYLGAFTSDEWNEMDSEWQEDYRAGNFDRACPNCDGKRVVDACNEAKCQSPTEKDQKFCYDHLGPEQQADLDSLAGMYAQEAAERAFGC